MIGDNIRALRTRAGLSQETLAKLLDVRQATVSDWECGKVSPSYEALCALSKALNTDFIGLMGEDEYQKAIKPILQSGGTPNRAAMDSFVREQKLRDAEAAGEAPPLQNEEAHSLRLRAQQIHDRLAKSMIDVQEANLELQSIISRIAEIERPEPKRK